MMNKETILEKAQKYDVITFDVFDTLIIRDVTTPTDIFSISYGKIGRYIRIISEYIARHRSIDREVTLKEIDEMCPFSCFKELEYEKKYCRANPAMQDIYHSLKASGKKMYAISDMYLSSDYISDLLLQFGYDIPVLVSCEEKCNKTSGHLFEVFLKRYSISSDSVLHIGDNTDADGVGAGKAGIDSIIIEKHKNCLSYTKIKKNNFELANFINHGLNELPDSAERIGYEIVGPVILAFCQWIHSQYIKFEFDRLFFLARDMHFSFDTYKKIYPEDNSEYLCISRKSLKSAETNPASICQYLRKKRCFGNVSIVDTGWVGGMQLTIEKYAKLLDAETDLGGLYLGAKLAYRKLNRSSKSSICFYNTIFEQFKCQLFPPFMETLIGSNEKQVIDYDNGEPVFDRLENRDFTSDIKSGAELFITDWCKYKNNKSLDLNAAIKPFEKMFYHPKSEDVNLLGNLHYEDFKDTKIVSFDEDCSYFRKPGKFISDLSDSGWKGAFLQKIGFMYPVVLLFYFIFGSLRLYLYDVKKIKNTKY